MTLKKARFESEQKTCILDAAIRVFGEKGYKGATICNLGRTAKVNSALLYYYYENKHKLFTESIRMIAQGLLDQFSRPHSPFSGPRDRLTFLVETIYDYYTEHPERMRLMAIVLTLHPRVLTETLRGFVGDKVVAPFEVIQEGIQKGEFRQAHPLQAWWSIIGLCLFSLLSQNVIPEVASKLSNLPPFNASNRKMQIVDLLMSGIALSPTP